MSVATIERDDLAEALAAARYTIVDALPAHAFAQRHLPGAINVVTEYSDQEVTAALPDLGAPIVVYSTDEHCDRAPALADRLIKLGYRDVRLFGAGIASWVADGLRVDHG